MKRRQHLRRLPTRKRARFLFEGLEHRLVMDGVVENEPVAIPIEDLPFREAHCLLVDNSRRLVAANGNQKDCSERPTIEPPSLQHFASAEELEQHLILEAVDQWKNVFGTNVPDYYPPIYYHDLLFDDGFLRVRGETNTGLQWISAGVNDADYSGTNVQVAGVDEGDLVKTDGKFLYIARENRLTIVDVQDPANMRIVSRVALDQPASELYIDGNRLTVISSHYSSIDVQPLVNAVFIRSVYPIRQEQSVQVDTYDITERGAPKELTSFEIDGNLVRSRAVGSHIVLVTQDDTLIPTPEIHCPVQTHEDQAANAQRERRLANGILYGDDFRPKHSCVYETEEEYVARLSDGLLETILPHYRTGGDGNQRAAFLTAPEKIAILGSLPPQSVSTTVIDIGGETPHVADSAGILTSYVSQVYATAENVYVAAPDWSAQTTRIFQFSLGEQQDSVAVTAVGEVSGQLLNQFSMDEHNGSLRVATTAGWGTTAINSVDVLQENEGQLVVVGSVTNITPGEAIFAARFMGDQAFLVTFQRTDPLVTLDLSDPKNPMVVGELEIPGFSHYLHPLAGGHLIGFGRDANPENGWATDPQISLFDVSDMSSPTLVDRETIASGSSAWSSAFFDHHAISFFEDASIFAVPFQLPGVTTTWDFRPSDAPPVDVRPFFPDVDDVDWSKVLQLQVPDRQSLAQLIDGLPDGNSVSDALRRVRQYISESLTDMLPDELPSMEELRRLIANLPGDLPAYLDRVRDRLSPELERLVPNLFSEGEGSDTPQDQPRTGLWVFHIDASADNPIELLGTISHDQPVDRSLRIGNTLFTISHDIVQAHELSNPGQVLDELSIGRLLFDDSLTIVVDDGVARIDVLGNDHLPAGSSITSVSESMRGAKVEISEDGRFVIYTPSTNVRPATDEVGVGLLKPTAREGHDTFTYTVDIGNGVNEKATVNVRLTRERVVPKMAELARQDLAARLGIGVDQINVAFVEPHIWGDSCLGVDDPDQACAQVITPGFVVWLAVNDRRYKYHTDTISTVVFVEHQDAHGDGVFPDVFRVRQDSLENELDVLANDFPNMEFIKSPQIGAVGETDQGGTVTIQEGGFKLLYTPAPGFHGTESFTYTVESGPTGKVTVRVLENADLPPNDPVGREPVVEIRLDVTDADGNSVTQLELGDQFFVNVYANDLRDEALGVFSPYFDLDFDVQLAEVSGKFEISPDYANAISGSSDRSGIDELGGYADSLKPLGPGERLVAKVPLKAIKVGKLLVVSNPADLIPQHDVGVYGSDSKVDLRQIIFSSVDIQIMNSFHNDLEPTDTDGDGTTSPRDALLIINWINEHGSGSTKMLRAAGLAAMAAGEAYSQESRRFDTNADGHCTHMDVLAIFNRVNANAMRRAAEQEASSANGVLPTNPGVDQPNSTTNPLDPTTRRDATELRAIASSLATSTTRGVPSGNADIGSRVEAIEALLDDLVGPLPTAEVLDDWFYRLGL